MRKFVYNTTAPGTSKGCSDLVQIKRLCNNQSEFLSNHDRPEWFKIFWVESGTIELHVNKRHFRADTGQMACIPPGHDVQVMSTSLSEVRVLSFSSDFLLQLELPDYQSYLFLSEQTIGDAISILDVPALSDLRTILKVAAKSTVNNGPFVTEMLKGVIQVIAVYLSRQSVFATQSAAYEIVGYKLFRTFLVLLEKYYVSKKSVIDYAKAMNVTPVQLSDAVKQASGKSASFYIHRRVIGEAKRLVLSSSSSMKQVAYQVGFTDIAHFSKFFRNQTGMNFTDYKRLWA